MSVTDQYLKNNEAYAAQFDGPLPLPPAGHVAVVVTGDEIRSLAISQRLLGTTEVILIHHTDCGMLTFTDDGFKRSIQEETGIKPEWAAEAFPDLDEDVRQS